MNKNKLPGLVIEFILISVLNYGLFRYLAESTAKDPSANFGILMFVLIYFVPLIASLAYSARIGRQIVAGHSFGKTKAFGLSVVLFIGLFIIAALIASAFGTPFPQGF